MCHRHSVSETSSHLVSTFIILLRRYLWINILPKFSIEGNAIFSQIYQNEIALKVFVVDSKIPNLTEIY